MRKAIQQSDLSSLSRTTAWRAKHRGWVRASQLDGFVPNTLGFYLYFADIEREIRYCAKTTADWDFPAWLDEDDRKQELRLRMFLLSGNPDFYSSNWRVTIMINRLKDLRKFKRDHFALLENKQQHSYRHNGIRIIKRSI